MDIPNWLEKYIKSEDLHRVEQAVQQAELKTSGEIVPLVVRSSSTTGHVFISLSLAFVALFFLTLYYFEFPFAHWTKWLVFVLGLLLSFRLEKMNFIRRLFTPNEDLLHQVQQRALNEFYEHRVHHTEKATGILIFVSMLEHKAIVLGDEAISNRIPQQTWDDIVSLLIKGIKRKEMAQGFVDAIEKSGQILAEHFPIEANDSNELSNHLIIKP